MYYSPSTSGFYSIEINGANIPPDAIEILDANYVTLLQGQSLGKRIVAGPTGPILQDPLPPTTDQLKAAAEAAIQNLLDNTAKSHGYDSILSLCSYATSTNLTWQKEGQYGCNYRDACWTKAEQIQTDATAGNWPTTGAGQVPTVNDVLAAMPAVVWPV